MYLHRHVRGPGVAELRHRHARVEEQRTSRPGTRLGQLLRREHPQGEAGVNELGREAIRRPRPSRDHLAEPDLPGVRDAFVDSVEGAALEQIGRVNGVAGPAQIIGEREETRRPPQDVVEHQNFGHVAPLSARSNGCRSGA